MASLLILQTAVDEGLGACFFGIPPDRLAAVQQEFGIPDASTRSARSPSVTRPAGGATGSPTSTRAASPPTSRPPEVAGAE